MGRVVGTTSKAVTLTWSLRLMSFLFIQNSDTENDRFYRPRLLRVREIHGSTLLCVSAVNTEELSKYRRQYGTKETGL